MAVINLPTNIQNMIFDDYINVKTYWKQYFSSSVLSFINAKEIHVIQYNKVLFEFMAYWGKKELEKYSVKGLMFSYKKIPIKQSFDNNTLWYILFEGRTYKNKRITLLFEKSMNNFDNLNMTYVEASGVFPYIDYGFGTEENLNRQYIENFQDFINQFMNAIFSC